jgi:predicted lipid-binding transport protein (Tim44 family)
MGEFQYADIIILALIALFVGLRLRNTLGKDIGHRPDLSAPSRRVVTEEADRVIHLQPQAEAAEQKLREEQDALLLSTVTDSSVTQTLGEIRDADPAFSVKEFLEGAKGAFEWVLTAFNNNDEATLKTLMSAEVFEDFHQAIEERKALGTKPETTLVAIEKTDIVRATLSDSTARLTVRYVTDQIQVERDKDGKIISGDPSQVIPVEDEWTFERNVKSRNPNWTIVAT